MNDIGIIRLTGRRGGFAIVDAEDFGRVNLKTWWMDTNGYVESKLRSNIRITLTRYILELPPQPHSQSDWSVVDHRNRITIDNRKQNLRRCNRSGNGANSVLLRVNNTSGYKGVSFDRRRGRWKGQIRVDWRNLWLGYFDTKEQAAIAYNAAAIHHFGEFATLNSVP